MRLSIIIPVYGVEQYIRGCLESVFSQAGIECCEVIVVNDGTPDKSMDIVEEFASHKNMTVIHQENQGLSAARNTGFDAANGDYVWFVDSDDTLLPHAVDNVLAAIDEHRGCDLFATVLLQKKESTGKTYVEYTPCLDVHTGREYMFAGNRLGASQRFIIRRQFLKDNGIEFMRGVYHEDGEFGHKMVYQAKSVYVLPKPVYCYLLRSSGSICSSRKPKMNTDLVKIYYVLADFAAEKVKDDDYWPFMALAANCMFDTVLFSNTVIFTPEFRKFYNENKDRIRGVALELLKHPTKIGRKQYIRALHFYFFPTFWTEFKQIVKRIIN